MKKAAVERSIIWGYWLAFFTLVTIAFYAYESSSQLRTSGIAAAHSYKVISTLTFIDVTATESESAFRGFLIAPNPEMKNTLINNETLLLATLNDLKSMSKANKEQLQNIEILEQKIDEFSRTARTMISIREIKGFDQAQEYFSTSESARNLKEIKLHLFQMNQMETKLLQSREDMRNELISSFNWLYLSLLSSVFIVMVILYFNIIKNIRKSDNI